MVRLKPRRRPVGNQLRANDCHVARSVNSQTHLPPLEPNDRDADVVAYEKFFHELAGQHQHVELPIQNVQVHFKPRYHFVNQYVSLVPGRGA
jgi:hypothetical protein